ncbi:MAG: TadE/TadG family type IV pilus assembly protein [Terriglobales bacterium]
MPALRVTGRRRQGGQTLAEMAIVLPLLALLIFAVIGLARLANVNEALHNACREGARWSAIPDATTGALPSSSDITSRVLQYAADDGITLTAAEVTVDQDVLQSEDGLATTFSQVQIAYPFQFLTPMMADLVPTLTLHPQAEMRNETN